MYQSIDDPQDQLAKPRGVRRAILIWLAAIIGIITVLAAIYVFSPRSAVIPEVNEALLAEQATYRKAIAETAPPMRRARLQDFLTTYPESSYVPVVEVQLDVINSREDLSWRRIIEAIFDGQMSRDEKLAALEAFETDWGGSLLGGRGEEIARLRAEITETAETPTLPDRKLKEGPSPIPKNVPDTELVGGPRPAAPRPPPEIALKEIDEEPIDVVELDIVQPSVSRNRKPRYPRKAMRRNIGAIVTLKLNIDAKGKVRMTELVSVEAERYEDEFVKAAEYAAMRTRFHPKTVGGQPAATVGLVKRYRFEAEN